MVVVQLAALLLMTMTAAPTAVTGYASLLRTALSAGRIVGVLFTERYVMAPAALLVLAAGYFVNSSFGPEGMTLEAFGNTRLSMMNSMIMLATSVGLSFLLIPHYGILGAAIASAGSMTLGGLAGVVETYLLYGFQPYSLVHLKCTAVALVAGCLTYSLGLSLGYLGTPGVLGLILLLTAVYALGLHYSRSLDGADYHVLSRARTRITDLRRTE